MYVRERITRIRENTGNMNQSENQRRMNLLMGKMFSQMRMDRNVSQESLGENIITQKSTSEEKKM